MGFINIKVLPSRPQEYDHVIWEIQSWHVRYDRIWVWIMALGFPKLLEVLNLQSDPIFSDVSSCSHEINTPGVEGGWNKNLLLNLVCWLGCRLPLALTFFPKLWVILLLLKSLFSLLFTWHFHFNVLHIHYSLYLYFLLSILMTCELYILTELPMYMTFIFQNKYYSNVIICSL